MNADKPILEPMGENNLLTAKVIAMVVLGAVSFVIGLIPIKITKYINIKSVDGDKNLLLSLMLCFGGGVLLFTTFLHLQPEVRESFELLEELHKIPEIGNGVPLSELVFCFGFFFVYFIEEIVHLCLHKKTTDNTVNRSFSLRYSLRSKKLTIPRVALNKYDDGNISYISNSNKDLLHSQNTLHVDHHQQEVREHKHNHFDPKIANSFSGLLAVLALSFHAVFEGLAVGLEPNVDKVWYLFIAIATHKFVIAFCVGIELMTSRTKIVLMICYIGTFAIVTPLGIGIGLIMTESGQSDEVDILSVVLQGMAAGTLLYVVFFEVLSRERNNKHSGVFQLLAIMLGFTVMLGLQFVTQHEHSHGNFHNLEHNTTHHHHHYEGDNHVF